MLVHYHPSTHNLQTYTVHGVEPGRCQEPRKQCLFLRWEAGSQILKSSLSCWMSINMKLDSRGEPGPGPRYYNMESRHPKESLHQTYISAALLITAKNWKQPKYLPIGHCWSKLRSL